MHLNILVVFLDLYITERERECRKNPRCRHVLTMKKELILLIPCISICLWHGKENGRWIARKFLLWNEDSKSKYKEDKLLLMKEEIYYLVGVLTLLFLEFENWTIVGNRFKKCQKLEAENLWSSFIKSFSIWGAFIRSDYERKKKWHTHTHTYIYIYIYR